MSEEREDEDGNVVGKPNAWWAQQRLGHSSEFRGVPLPKPGPQSVRPEDTIGDYDTCWCGEPADHDWPGKAQGRKHPKESKVAVAVAEQERPHITRAQLRGYDDDYIEIIVRAVNDYGTRFRFTSGGGIILYPKDGSEAYSLNKRANPRKLKAARIWFAKHVVGVTAAIPLVKDVEVLADDMDMKERLRVLAEAKNGPEHPVPEEKTEPVRREIPIRAVDWIAQYLAEHGGSAPARQVIDAGVEFGFTEKTLKNWRGQVADTGRSWVDGAPVHTWTLRGLEPVDPVEESLDALERGEATVKRVEKRPEPAPQPASEAPSAPVDQEPTVEVPTPQEAESAWKTYVTKDGKTLERFETNGTDVRCRECDVTLDKGGASVAGHMRTRHGDGGLWDERAQEKKRETRKINALHGSMTQAIKILQAAMGEETDAKAKKRVAELEKQVTHLETAVSNWQAKAEKAIKEAEDLSAKLALIREATGL